MKPQEIFFLGKGDFIYYEGERHEIVESHIKSTRVSKVPIKNLDSRLIFSGEMLSGYVVTETHNIPIKLLLEAKLINII